MRLLRKAAAIVLAAGMVSGIVGSAFAASPLPDYSGEWTSFRGNEENIAVVDYPTPIKDATLKWGKKMGTGWDAAPTPPIIVNDHLYIANGQTVKILDKDTGAVLKESQVMAGSFGFAMNPMVYAEGMLFVHIGSGRIQALNAETLESLWISEELGGQTISPITYHDGYIYTGTWNNRKAGGDTFFCLSVKDEDPARTDEIKKPVWKLNDQGENGITSSYYWMGAYATDNYVVFGTDTHKVENEEIGSWLYSCDPLTGKVLDKLEGFNGDMRTSIAYDKATDRLYFATKNGVFYSVKINRNGTFDKNSLRQMELGGMCTSTPVVYNGRSYVGVSGSSQFDANAGHKVKVIDVSKLNDGQEPSVIYDAVTPGYVQVSPMLTTAYEKKTGKVYIYVTYNAPPGGIYVIEDSAGQAEANVYNLFTPPKEMQEYSICAMVADSDGTIYYKNDSCYLMAVASQGHKDTGDVTGDKDTGWYATAVKWAVGIGAVSGAKVADGSWLRDRSQNGGR